MAAKGVLHRFVAAERFKGGTVERIHAVKPT
jgi:hypothetical protein